MVSAFGQAAFGSWRSQLVAESSKDPCARSQAGVTRKQLLQWDPPRLHEVMQTAWSWLDGRPAWRIFRTTAGPARLPLFTVTGSTTPNAETYAYDDGSVLIAITDGMIRFMSAPSCSRW
jgi:hypothetical protein